MAEYDKTTHNIKYKTEWTEYDKTTHNIKYKTEWTEFDNTTYNIKYKTEWTEYDNTTYNIEFEDTKGPIRIRISNKNRKHNGQKKKYKGTNNDQQNIHIKLKIE
jgi:hypothetical protein